MFLEVDGEIVGRVTFTRPSEAAAYTTVNDKYMVEGVRYYDGTQSTSGAAQLNDCPGPSQDYGPPGGPDERPLIFYTKDGQLLENRSYTATTGEAIEAGELVFRELERITQPFVDVGALGINAHTVYERVTVGAYVYTGGEWNLAIVVYYDTLSAGHPILQSIPPGATIGATDGGSSAADAESGDPGLDAAECRTSRSGVPQCRTVRGGG